MGIAQSKRATDSLASLASLGAIAYICETLGHEALGHGSACIMLGGHVEAIAPLWMRCSLTSKWITAAGPAFNFLAAVVLAALLSRIARLTPITFLLWLSCAFNALVACGYMMVGGATMFGDWAVLFDWVEPPWLWRTAAVAIGLAAYLACGQVLAKLYGRLAAPQGFAQRLLRPRMLVPGCAAALVACAAEFAAGVRQPAGFVLPLACTLLAALPLFGMLQGDRVASGSGPATLPASWSAFAGALLLSAFFVCVIGLGASKG